MTFDAWHSKLIMLQDMLTAHIRAVPSPAVPPWLPSGELRYAVCFSHAERIAPWYVWDHKGRIRMTPAYDTKAAAQTRADELNGPNPLAKPADEDAPCPVNLPGQPRYQTRAIESYGGTLCWKIWDSYKREWVREFSPERRFDHEINAKISCEILNAASKPMPEQKPAEVKTRFEVRRVRWNTVEPRWQIWDNTQSEDWVRFDNGAQMDFMSEEKAQKYCAGLNETHEK